MAIQQEVQDLLAALSGCRESLGNLSGATARWITRNPEEAIRLLARAVVNREVEVIIDHRHLPEPNRPSVDGVFLAG